MALFLVLLNILTLIVGTVGCTLGVIAGNILSIAIGGVAVLLSIYTILANTQED